MLFLQQFNESKKVTKRVKTRFGESQARLRLTFKHTFSSDLKKVISAKHSKRNSRAASNRKLPKKEQLNQKKLLSLTRQRLLRLCILLSLASMASHSASANVLDPIRRVLSPIISIIDKKTPADSMAQSTQSRSEPTTPPPIILVTK